MKKSILICATLVVCAMSVAAQPRNAEWRSNMNELSKALAEAIPYLYPDPTLDQKNLSQKVKRIHELTKNFDVKTGHGIKMPDNDPVLPYVASMFRQEIERAYLSLQDGHAEYGKAVLRSSVSYCITCHTRTSAGTQFPLLSAFEGPLSRASWIEKLEFQTASRQYDTVLSEVMGQLKNAGPVGISPMDMERGARVALSILVRLKKDPDRAALLTQAMGSSPTATLSMKEASRAWLKDIRIWQAEKDRKYGNASDYLSEARKLTGGTEPAEHAEVRNLRASALLHEFLQSAPKGPEGAEALFLTGKAYGRLGEIGMWSLHEFYYLACIDRAPHSKIAESCYAQYAESMTLGYSGSGGVRIPKQVRDELARLKEKAQVKAAVPNK